MAYTHGLRDADPAAYWAKLRPYSVQEFAAGKYFTVKSFATLDAARDECARLGYKARIMHDGKRVK